MFRFCGGGGSVGKFFCRIGRCGIFCRVRLSHSFCGWEISTKRIQRTNRVRSRTVKKTPPAQTKNFPQEHPPKQSETNYRNAAAGALGGSSGRMREVWREKEPPPKGGSFSLQGLSFPHFVSSSSTSSANISATVGLCSTGFGVTSPALIKAHLVRDGPTNS